MRVLLSKSERLTLFVQKPTFWDFTFEPRFLTIGEDDLEFIEPLWGRLCARARARGIVFNQGQPKPWRVNLGELVDFRERGAAVLEDGRMRLLGVGARLQGMRKEYGERETLTYMLKLAMIAGDAAQVRTFLQTNAVPAAIRGLGYRQIVDDLMKAIEVQ